MNDNQPDRPSRRYQSPPIVGVSRYGQENFERAVFWTRPPIPHRERGGFRATPGVIRTAAIVTALPLQLILMVRQFAELRDASSVTAMRWFRSRARLTSWLALLALTAQLALSFGHVHADQLAPAAIASHAAAVPSGGTPIAPVKPDGVAHDFCAICALIHLASTLVPSAAPSLPAPVVFSQPRFELIASVALTASPHASFQARAPPIA